MLSRVVPWGVGLNQWQTSADGKPLGEVWIKWQDYIGCAEVAWLGVELLELQASNVRFSDALRLSPKRVSVISNL